MAVKPGPAPSTWGLDLGTKMAAELDRVRSLLAGGEAEHEVIAKLGSPRSRNTSDIGGTQVLSSLVYAPFDLPDADFISQTNVPVEVQLRFDLPPGGAEPRFDGAVLVTTQFSDENIDEAAPDEFRGAAEAIRRILEPRHGQPAPRKTGNPKHGSKFTCLQFETADSPPRHVDLSGGTHYGACTVEVHDHPPTS